MKPRPAWGSSLETIVHSATASESAMQRTEGDNVIESVEQAFPSACLLVSTIGICADSRHDAGFAAQIFIRQWI